MIVTPTFFGLIFLRFFNIGTARARRTGFSLASLPIVLMAGVCVALLFCPSLVGQAAVSCMRIGIVAISVAVYPCLLSMTIWLRRKIDAYHRAEFSNVSDFPYAFARKILLLPWLILLKCAYVFISCDRTMMVVLWILFSVLMVYYTITIMSPQTGMTDGGLGEETHSEEASDEKQETVAPDTTGDSLNAIRNHVIEIARRRYLEQHVSRRDIISELDYGERSIAGDIITEYGFYDMINTLRLEHARRYSEAHPNETKESVAVSSGFKDRYAMRYAERKIVSRCPEILDGFEPEI